jgi:hypothetical protein
MEVEPDDGPGCAMFTVRAALTGLDNSDAGLVSLGYLLD